MEKLERKDYNPVQYNTRESRETGQPMPESSLPSLMVPPAEAKARITAQIEQGSAILESLRSAHTTAQIGLGFGLAGAFEQAVEQQKNWTRYTIDLLKMLFSDQSIAKEFGPWEIPYVGYSDEFAKFARGVKERIRRLESIVQRLPLFPLSAAETKSKTTGVSAHPTQQGRDIFIVHGHDDAAKHEVARFIDKLGLQPIILHEQADRGRTIIEKFEAHSSDVGFAVVLLTPDDVGYPKGDPSKAKSRARQNVVLELGFFLGTLGRARVCALRKGDIEIPNDYEGVLYKLMDDGGGWKLALAKEIKEAGIEVDMNNAV